MIKQIFPNLSHDHIHHLNSEYPNIINNNNNSNSGGDIDGIVEDLGNDDFQLDYYLTVVNKNAYLNHMSDELEIENNILKMTKCI